MDPGRSELSSSQIQRAQEAISFLSSLPLSSTPPPRPFGSSSSSSSNLVNENRLSAGSLNSGPNSDLQTRCNAAISNVREIRQGTQLIRRRSVREELLATLRGTSKKKSKRKPGWRHKFVCLARTGQNRIPLSESEKDKLFSAGLGEKELEFPKLDTTADEFRDILYEGFPRLRDGGGYQFLKCIPNSRQLEPLSGLVMSSPMLLKQRVGATRTYIRPLQQNLDTTPNHSIADDEMNEKCLQCNRYFPVSELPEHIQNCESSERASDSNCSDHELPPWRQNNDDEQQPRSSLSVVDLTNDENETEECLIQQIMRASSDLSPQPNSATINIPRDIDHDQAYLSTNSIINHLNMEVNGSFNIDVRRSHLLQDALKEARKKKFDPRKLIKVTFIGEGAIDYGGPRREFFRLLIQQLSESDYMHGGKSKFFVSDVPAIQRQDFRLIGFYAGMSVIQGGPGFPLLADEVIQYLSTGKSTGIQVADEDLPLMMKSLFQEIRAATTDSEVSALFSDEQPMYQTALLETGYGKAINNLSMNDTAEIMSVMMDYHCMLKSKAAMDQFAEGLECTGVLHYIKHYTDIMKPLFTHQKSVLTADYMKGLFAVTYSTNEKRTLEEQAYVYFGDFLDDCETGDIQCSLEEALIFCSGADSVPVGGFNKKIDIVFLGDNEILPTASTCSLVMRIPTCHNSNEKFNEMMLLGLQGGIEFGSV